MALRLADPERFSIGKSSNSYDYIQGVNDMVIELKSQLECFTVTNSVSFGAMIQSLVGIMAKPTLRQYWEFLQYPNIIMNVAQNRYFRKSQTEGIQNQDKTGTKANKQKPPPHEKKRTPDMGVRPGAQEE
ncbi:hypothetical protein FSP39_012238 [Pinctada imbricata]|uniref:Uncharacterized protein n=1 Tax=Pinctada imbricata TaxID=66713 RepID=A0AA88XU75_PINIB|nr:hypothetical protein FSP39_012238 [Pinctada imbricata]